jgi:hypothetical protein
MGYGFPFGNFKHLARLLVRKIFFWYGISYGLLVVLNLLYQNSFKKLTKKRVK